MTVTNILLRAYALANVAGGTPFTAAEKDDSLNAAYREVYERIIDADDDFFVTDWSFALSGMTAVSGDPGAYYIALPATFYRLRLLEYSTGTGWAPVRKYALQDDERGAGPQYRFKGVYLYIVMPSGSSASSFRAWYYPAPAVYASATGGSTDIATPPQLDVDILAYQIAIDIKRKQSSDYAQLAQRKDEIMGRFIHAVGARDNWGAQKVANVYAARGL